MTAILSRPQCVKPHRIVVAWYKSKQVIICGIVDRRNSLQIYVELANMFIIFQI